MMQVYIDAIEASRTGNTQYVLSKGLDIVRVYDKKALYSLLKEGYEIRGIYHNGVGEYDYTIASSNEISIIKDFLSSALDINFGPFDKVSIRFQEFFEPIAYKREELKCFVTLFVNKNSSFTYENLVLKEETASKLQNLLFRLGCKQESSQLIKLLKVFEGE